MLNNFPGLQSLSQWIGGRQAQAESPAIDIWVYAGPAGEEADPLLTQCVAVAAFDHRRAGPDL
jgi:hypothetical protein